MRRRGFLALSAALVLAGCNAEEDPPEAGGDTPNGENGESDAPEDEETDTPPEEDENETAPENDEGDEEEAEDEEADEEGDQVEEMKDRDAFVFEGEESALTEAFDLGAGFTGYETIHEGEGSFVVELIDDEQGETVADLADAQGNHEARNTGNFPEGAYVLDVTADGEWTVELRQPRPSEEDADELPMDVSGEVPDYFGPYRFEDSPEVRANYEGDHHSLVEIVDLEGEPAETLFDERGAFEGETTVEYEGAGWIDVVADDTWSLTFE